MNAIAAMTRHGRVIGRAGVTPWRQPEEMRWFQEVTAGAAVLMGRRTFESLARPLPGRRNLVASRRPLAPAVVATGAEWIADLDSFCPDRYQPQTVWVIGGAEIYAKMLRRCAAVYLSLIDIDVPDGDTFFPEFEADFPRVETIRRGEGFEVRRYRRAEAAGLNRAN